MDKPNKLLCKTRRSFLKRISLSFGGLCLASVRGLGSVMKRPLPARDLKFISSKMTLIPRREWTSQDPKYWAMREAGSFNRLTFHHQGQDVNKSTVRNSVIHNLEGILAGHTDRKYGDIAYHFIVDYAGRIWEGRSIAYEGAHVANNNEKNIGVVVLGNFEEQQPSKEQLDSVKQLTEILTDHFKIDKANIYGHRDLGSSACPGKNFYPFIKEMTV